MVNIFNASFWSQVPVRKLHSEVVDATRDFKCNYFYPTAIKEGCFNSAIYPIIVSLLLRKRGMEKHRDIRGHRKCDVWIIGTLGILGVVSKQLGLTPVESGTPPRLRLHRCCKSPEPYDEIADQG